MLKTSALKLLMLANYVINLLDIQYQITLLEELHMHSKTTIYVVTNFISLVKHCVVKEETTCLCSSVTV